MATIESLLVSLRKQEQTVLRMIAHLVRRKHDLERATRDLSAAVHAGPIKSETDQEPSIDALGFADLFGYEEDEDTVADTPADAPTGGDADMETEDGGADGGDNATNATNASAKAAPRRVIGRPRTRAHEDPFDHIRRTMASGDNRARSTIFRGENSSNAGNAVDARFITRNTPLPAEPWQEAVMNPQSSGDAINISVRPAAFAHDIATHPQPTRAYETLALTTLETIAYMERIAVYLANASHSLARMVSIHQAALTHGRIITLDLMANTHSNP